MPGYNMCPKCGTRKQAGAKLCYHCRFGRTPEETRLRHICPQCGGPKTKVSGLCQRCYIENIQNTPESFWSMVRKAGENDCWEWTARRDKNGYGKLKYNGHNCSAHRLAWEFTNGSIPDDLYVCHVCDRRSCCNPAHLFLGTNADNMHDMVKKGRSTRGESHPNTVLTVSQVIDIRARYKPRKVTMKHLAEEYRVYWTTIRSILYRKSWSWL